MAGLQYKFFPTDFFVPTFEPNVVESSPKAIPINNSNPEIDGSDESSNKENKTKFNKKKSAKLSLSYSGDSNKRSITPVMKNN